jgi:hypothetical protein
LFTIRDLEGRLRSLGICSSEADGTFTKDVASNFLPSFKPLDDGQVHPDSEESWLAHQTKKRRKRKR